MTLGTRHKIQQAGQLNISIGYTQFNLVSFKNILGVHIDEALSWNQHIDDLCSIISSRISLLCVLLYYVPENVQKCFIKAMLYLLIDYGSSSWGFTTKLNIEKKTNCKKEWHVLFQKSTI